ncbi:MAG: hypothetical protein Q8S57_06215 [Methanoregula sp.]|nr:hypothetical protein [Methanoregula sp.]
MANRVHGYIALNKIFQIFSHAHAFMLNNFFVKGGSWVFSEDGDGEILALKYFQQV